MGLFNAIIGNAGAVSVDELRNKYSKLFFEGEEVEMGFKLIRDTFIFTNHRLILIDVQGVTGTKTSYKSVSYRSISRFSVESSGIFDLDAELKIWISAEDTPSISKQFSKSVDVYEVQSLLARHVCK